jgi:hypothetical protein
MIMLLQFLSRFGAVNGVKLFIKFRLGYVDKVRIPGIKSCFSLRRETSDIPTFYHVFPNKGYDMNLEKPQLIIDSDAEAGLFAILMQNKYPDAKIICMEPNPESFNLLLDNVVTYKNIYCENYGIGDYEGGIPAISMSTLCRKYAINHIDVLKMDMKTSEKRMFSADFDDWLPKVKTIIMTGLHDRPDEGCPKPFFEAINKSFSQYKVSFGRGNVVIKNLG